MNVMILSSSKEEIADYYKVIAKNISHYLASSGFDLVFGAASSSMMGICYREFINQGRNVYAFTTEKYAEDLANLPLAKSFVRETTLDMKKSMFENSDFIVALSGGLGTLSEILSFIEENRSNDKSVPIILYDEDHYYQKLFELFNNMKALNFISDGIEDYIKIAHNKNEFIEALDMCVMKGKKGIL